MRRRSTADSVARELDDHRRDERHAPTQRERRGEDLTLAHGTYTAAQLTSAVQDAATAAGAAINATAARFRKALDRDHT